MRGMSARAWNRAQDAADIVLGTMPDVSGSGSSAPVRPYLWAYCQAGITVKRWGVVEISGVAISASTDAFEEVPVFTGVTPTATSTKWAIAVEPIASGNVGRVAIDGVVQCKVEVKSETDRFVVCKSSTDELQTSPTGEGLILWKESGTGSGKWAIIRIGTVRSHVRGTFSGSWAKNATATVTDAVTSSVTYTAKNYFSALTGTGTKACAIAYVGGEWILIAAEC
jgi:hypothetical protein